MKATTTFLLNMKGYADAFADCRGGKPVAINLWVVVALDPNDKYGPAGFTSDRYVAYPEKLHYAIQFENLSSATAPAQKVVVEDSLDLTKVDIQSFQFGPLGFGDFVTTPVQTGNSILEYVDLRQTLGIFVKIEGLVNQTTGKVTWSFSSIDPMTLEPIDDPLLGFLPPNVIENEGQSFVQFSVKPKNNLSHNTTIANKAIIVFDNQPPMATNVWSNTLDLQPPTGSITGHQLLNDTTVLLQWPNATDNGSGIREYHLYVSENNNPYQLFYTGSSAKSLVFTGKLNHTYRFNICGVDSVGNIQNQASTPDLTLTFQHVGLQENHEAGLIVFPNPVQHTLHFFNASEGQQLWEIID